MEPAADVRLIPYLTTNVNRVILSFCGSEDYHNTLQYVNHSLYSLKSFPKLIPILFASVQPLLVAYSSEYSTLLSFSLRGLGWESPEQPPKIPQSFAESASPSVVHTPENMIFCFTSEGAIFALNPAKSSLQRVGALLFPRKGFALLRVGQSIYTIAGEKKACERFDYIKRKSIALAEPKLDAVSAAVCEVQGKWICRFTVSFSGYMSGMYQNSDLVERYSIETNIWEALPVVKVEGYKPMPGAACFAINGEEIIVFGRVMNKQCFFVYNQKESTFRPFPVPASAQHMYADTYYPENPGVLDRAEGSFYVQGATKVLRINPAKGLFEQYAT